MAEINADKDRSKPLRCLTCNTVTIHKLEFSYTENFTDDPDFDPANPEAFPQFWEERTYSMWSCAGCRAACLEISVKDHGFSPGGEEPVSVFYPEYTSSKRKIKIFKYLERTLYGLYRESVLCYNAGAHIACAACLRSLLEGILIERGIKVDDGKKNDLYNKINKLKTIPLVPETTVTLLHSFRFMGNEALHKLKAPTEWEIRFAVEAIEQLIYYIYESEMELHEKLRILASFRKDEINQLSIQVETPENVK